jgi:integrase
MLGKITKSSVEKLPPGGEWLWDSVVKGFGARRQTDGIFYHIRYRLNGRQHVKSLGRHGSPLTPDIARTTAKAKLGIVATGADPFTQPLAAESFGKEVGRYLERKRDALKPRAFAEVERHLLNHAKPLHRLCLGEIDRRAIAALLAEIEDTSGPVARNRVRSSLSAFLAWAVREGFIETNPVAATGKAGEGGARERVLTEAELQEVWSALPQDQFGDIARLLILTGQRREEIGWLQWDEIDFERGLIALPPERTKNKRLHELPLSTQARAILKAQSRRKGRNFLFGLGKGGFSGWSDCKERLDQTILAKRGGRAKPMLDWRLHDLRRTAATGMAELGIQPHIIEAVLNHVSGHKAGVAGIYNRARYAVEMRDALQRWADYVEALIVGPRKQPAGLMERAFAVARGGKIVPNEDLANLARQIKT